MLTAQATFRVALIQMRSGRSPAANLDAATKLIAEAKAGGADYVQTPEMTNILESRRDALMAAIKPEHEDPSLAAFRDLARRHRLWLHVGSLALKISPDRAVNRGFLIDPEGGVAARYDKIHMFDVDLPNGESDRERLFRLRGGARRQPRERPRHLWALACRRPLGPRAR